jgi:lysophospholipase L1-like esterase
MAVLYQPGHDPSRVYYGTDTRAQSLLIGAILAVLLADRGPVRSLRLQTLLHRGAIAAAVVLGIVWTTTTDGDAWQYRGGFVIAAVLVAVIIASVAQPDASGPLGRALSTTPLRAIGIISYGLYLWHWPIYVFLSADRMGVNGSALLMIRLVATFAVATLSYVLVESPIRHRALPRTSLRIATPAVAVGLAIVVVTSTAGPLPVAFSATSASQLRPPSIRTGVAATAKLAGSKKRPVRVLLVGDSVADSLAPGLAAALTARGYVFWNASVPGCGIASDVGERWFAEWRGVDPHCLPGWRQRWPGEIAAFKPDIVVGLFGGQDAFDRRIDGRVIRFDTPDGAALAHEELQGAVNILSSRGAHVVLLSTPYYVLGWPQKVQVDRSTLNPLWINRYNGFEHDIAEAQPRRVTLLNLNHYLDPEGHWTDTVDGIKVRTFDKCHLSPAGAAFVAKWLTPQLASYQPNA